MESKDYSAMQQGKPYSSFKKTILGKLFVKVLDPFRREPSNIILKGSGDNCVIDAWTIEEDLYIRRSNPEHIRNGYLIPYTRKETTEVVDNVNNLSDEEMINLLDSKFLALQAKVKKMTSVAPIFRLLEVARGLEKSEKIIKYLEGELARIQLAELQTEE
jgi:hypothetical protein